MNEYNNTDNMTDNMEENTMNTTIRRASSRHFNSKCVFNILAKTAVLLAVVIALITSVTFLVAESEMVYYHLKISHNEHLREKALKDAESTNISDIERAVYITAADAADQRVELYSTYRDDKKSSKNPVMAFVAQKGFRWIHTLDSLLGCITVVLLFFAFRKKGFFRNLFTDLSYIFGRLAANQ